MTDAQIGESTWTKISEDIARRVTDPDRVLTTLENLPGAEDWNSQSRHALGSGLLGPAILLGGDPTRASHDGPAAHDHMRSVARWVTSAPALNPGLYTGQAGVAFGIAMRQRATGGYTGALRELDRKISTGIAAICRRMNENSIGDRARFDTMAGLAGIGRYALMRPDSMAEALRTVLSTLVGMSESVRTGGLSVPGYWCLTRPRGEPVDSVQEGHLNLGLSHGIAGPLALLSLARSSGIEVPHQERAIERLAQIFQEQKLVDHHGVYWPNLLTWDDWRRGYSTKDRGRAAWCYGSLGIACSLQLAAAATGRRDLGELATDSVDAILRTPLPEWGIRDVSLCHGWAGALNCLKFFTGGERAEDVSRARDHIAAIIEREFDPDSPFGFRYPDERQDQLLDRPGFLDGASGIALALEAYSSGETSAAPWDAALLLA
ncbi:lanthionine synthetase C family protein [Streptomyces sp. NPDC059849]|uniref:lanthionine synthetase C family protein n=1 Tax=Streptomyces sp. NPDC059849 TaxID=3346969 RepID=UPI0036536639